MKKTKGLSTIVATLIIILLVLVAVGIIWVVVRNVLEGGAEQITGSYECTTVTVKPTKVVCDAALTGGNDGVCDVTYTREAGGDEIGGIKIILSNGEETFMKDISGNLNELGTATESNIDTTVGTTITGNITRVETAVYFLDDSGEEHLCDPSGYKEIQLN